MSQPPAPAPAAAPRRLRGAVLTFLKVGLSAALLAWLFQKGGLDDEPLKRALSQPLILGLVLLIGFVGISLSGLRWAILLRVEGIELPVLEVLRLNWIGHFWNMVIPGAVSGDAVKMYYVGKLAPGRREEAWTTVVADRVIGLAALVALSTLATLSSLEEVWARTELRNTFLTMLAVLAAFALGGLVLGLGVGRGSALAERVRQRAPAADLLRRGYHVLLRLGRRPRAVLVSFLISFVGHAMAVGNAFLLGRAAGEMAVSALNYFVLVPIALFSNALPITPGGVGVGEAVLGRLFAWSGGQEKDGVAVMLLIRLMFYVLATLGAVLYALYRRQEHGPLAPAASAPASVAAGPAPAPGADGAEAPADPDEVEVGPSA